MPGRLAEKLFLALPAFRDVGATIYGLALNRERYGGDYREAVDRILERDTWTERELMAYRDRRLREILEIAFRHVPYYRETLRRLGLSPDDFAGAGDLPKLPILEKETVRADPLQFVDERLNPSRLAAEITTGTTGTPVRVLLTRRIRQEHFAFFEARCRRVAGLRYGEEPHVTFGVKRVVPVERTRPPFWCYNHAGRQLYMSVFHLDEPYLAACCDELRRRPYRALIGYASAISRVARHALEAGIRDLRIPVAITSGEMLTARQRETIERAFGCRVFDQYGCTEMSVFAAERACGRMHLSPDYSVVEIVDDSGRPVAPGQTGHVLGTSLLNDAQILLRYRVGDMASLEASPCACGSPLPLVGRVEGRSLNAVILPDGRRLYRFAGLDTIPSVKECQVVQEEVGVFTIYVVAASEFGDAEARQLAASLETSVGRAKIRVEIVRSISRGRGGKSATIVSRVAAPEDAPDGQAGAGVGNVRVTVQSGHGVKSFEFPPQARIAEVMAAAEAAFEVRRGDRSLLAPANSPGTALAAGRTLESYGIRNGTALVLTTVGMAEAPAGYRPTGPGTPARDDTPPRAATETDGRHGILGMVRSKKTGWLLLLVLAIAGGGFLAVRWYRSRPLPLAAQLKRLPQQDAVVVYVDFARLRRAGILGLLDSSKVTEDADYRDFARKINLNWKQDLDSVMLALAPSGKYMVVAGRFDWKKLRAYAQGAGGECYGSVCRLTGSTPERRISFLPLQENVMALAVSTDEWAARTLQGEAPGPNTELPEAPVWVKVPGSALKSGNGLPDGTRMFAHSIGQADFAILTLAPDGQRLAAKLDVHCNDARDAADIAGELSHATTLLREMIEREHQTPNPADFSGVLSSGNFWSQGNRVYGNWPIERSFIENLLGGA